MLSVTVGGGAFNLDNSALLAVSRFGFGLAGSLRLRRTAGASSPAPSAQARVVSSAPSPLRSSAGRRSTAATRLGLRGAGRAAGCSARPAGVRRDLGPARVLDARRTQISLTPAGRALLRRAPCTPQAKPRRRRRPHARRQRMRSPRPHHPLARALGASDESPRCSSKARDPRQSRSRSDSPRGEAQTHPD